MLWMRPFMDSGRLDWVELNQSTKRVDIGLSVASRPLALRFAVPAGYYFLAGFGSRFIFKSSSVTAEDTPSAGTSSFAVQKSAFKTSRRKF